MNVSWLRQRRAFPACAEGGGTALRGGRAAHGGQDDRVVRWADGVEHVKKRTFQSTELQGRPCAYSMR